MFGHHDDNDQADQPVQDQPAPQDNTAIAPDPTAQVIQPGPAEDQPAPDLAAPAAPAEPISDDSSWQHPGTPLDNTPVEPIVPAPISDVTPGEGVSSAPTFRPGTDVTPSADSAADDLVDIRQKALGDLSPLIDHLEHQTPEEKFQVTMMMIQANDDKTLIKTAYETAQQIPDEKVRAQALLDVVQEINYFTQHNAGE
jgi:hypothetical protein